MIINNTKTLNFNATSAIEVGGKTENVMYMYGSVNAEGLPSWNSNIANFTFYLANKDEVDKDFKDFQQEIIDSISE